ncbi:MAG: DNA topoisomerase [Fibrobacterota bacterium]|nr:DNA topoisomerase [Fibrobacterota bacterium]
MKLLIAEKPAVARTLKEMLERMEGERFTQRDGYFEGRSYWISWCVGHLVGLSDPDEYGWKQWRLQDLPMVPKAWKLKVLPGVEKQFRVLQDLIGRCDSIINATDAGREGELIYGLVAEKAGSGNKSLSRLWLNSFVPADMEKAWKKLIPGQRMAPLYQSALCRAKADWLVGMNLSRGYALGTGTRKLSVGRVQTPTLGLIVKRDLEIENWKDRVFFQLTGLWRQLRFLYVRDKETKFDISNELLVIQRTCEGQQAELVVFEKQQRKQYPPKPFDLGGLQKSANKILGLKAATTLEIAQSLYEKKWITYPRTDSQYLPEGMKEDAWATLQKVATIPEKEVCLSPSDHFSFFDSSKVSDHFAIIPTGQMNGQERLEEKERKVFDLIRSRFVLAFGRPYEFEEYRLELACMGLSFKARATRELKIGFKALFKTTSSKEENLFQEEPENKLTASLAWHVGERDILHGLTLDQKKATKPLPYTEATLLSAMETAGKAITDEAHREAMKERGLGTPATKAAIIEKLKIQEYITAQGKSLLSTVKGRELIHLVDEKVASPEMTGDWEFKLNQIAKGKFGAGDFLDEIISYVSGLGASFTSAKAKSFSSRIYEVQPARTMSKTDSNLCPKCQKAGFRENSYGLFCEDKDGCGFKLWAKVGEKKLSPKNLTDLLSKGKTGMIKGFKSKEGKKFDAALKLQDWRVVYDFDDPPKPTTQVGRNSKKQPQKDLEPSQHPQPLPRRKVEPWQQKAPENQRYPVKEPQRLGSRQTTESESGPVALELKEIGLNDFGICPKCKIRRIITGKFGYQCEDWRGCGFKVGGEV